MYMPSPYGLLDLETGKVHRLQYGNNLVGRAESVPDPSFVDASNPTLSRCHALIIVAPNDDVWLKDCKSTNGTQLSINPGSGLVLDPTVFYQVSPGACIIFGSLTMSVIRVERSEGNEKGCTSHNNNNNESSINSHNALSSPPLAPVGVNGADIAAAKLLRAGPDGSEGKRMTKESGADKDRGESEVTAARPSRSKKKESAGGKRSRVDEANGNSPPAKPPAARDSSARRSASRDPILTPIHRSGPIPRGSWGGTKIMACLSGMDIVDRQPLIAKIRALGGTVFEEWNDKVNLLVVKTSPASRTPKLLSALTRGVFVVTSDFFDSKRSMDDIRDFVPAVTSADNEYSRQQVLDTIDYGIYVQGQLTTFRGLLSPYTFSLSSLNAKQKGVAHEVIMAGGGRVLKAKKDEKRALKEGDRLVVLTPRDIDKFFTGIMTGCIPDALSSVSS